MAAGTAVPVALLAYLAPNSFLRGVAVGGGTVAIAALLATLVSQATGTASLRLGADAEQLTAGELRPLLRAGWLLINHVSLAAGDIDHVLVGPAGVVAVETKWSATPWRLDRSGAHLLRATAQARGNAATLSRWHPMKKVGVEQVWSTVFLWSAVDPDAEPLPAHPIRSTGTQVVHGRAAAAEWRSALQGAPTVLSDKQVREVYAEIDAHLRKRDASDADRAPVPATLSRAYWILGASVAAFVVACLISLYAFTFTRSLIAWALITAASGCLGFLGRASAVPRVVRASWLTGSIAITATMVVSLLL